MTEATDRARTGAGDAVRAGLDQFHEVVADIKPRLRGWLHLGTAPLTLAAGIVLIWLSPTRRPGSDRPRSSAPR